MAERAHAASAMRKLQFFRASLGPRGPSGVNERSASGGSGSSPGAPAGWRHDIEAAVRKVFKASRQRCRVHFMRNALAHAGNTQRRIVSAAIATIFAQETGQLANEQGRAIADQLRPRFQKLGELKGRAENDVLACMALPKVHWQQIHSTNPIERLNAEVKRRTDVVGIFPNDRAIVRLVGAILNEQSDEWALQRRYLQLEGLQSLSDTRAAWLSAIEA